MIRNMLRAALLVLTLSSVAFAGDMQNPVAAQGSIPNGVAASGNMPNEATIAGNIPNDQADASAGTSAFEAALLLLMVTLGLP